MFLLSFLSQFSYYISTYMLKRFTENPQNHDSKVNNNFQESSRWWRTIYPLFSWYISRRNMLSPHVFWHLGSEQRGNNDIILRGKRVSFDLSAISTVSLTRVFDAKLAARRNVARLFLLAFSGVGSIIGDRSCLFCFFFFFFFFTISVLNPKCVVVGTKYEDEIWWRWKGKKEKNKVD